MKNFISTFKELKIVNFLFLTLAGIINAFGVVVFLAPVKLYDSGISGNAYFARNSCMVQFITYTYFT